MIEAVDINAMVFLASDEARYITGVTLPSTPVTTTADGHLPSSWATKRRRVELFGEPPRLGVRRAPSGGVSAKADEGLCEFG